MFALIISRSGSLSAMILKIAIHGHHDPLVCTTYANVPILMLFLAFAQRFSPIIGPRHKCSAVFKTLKICFCGPTLLVVKGILEDW